ncbi:hypothetical protein M6B38_340505 [Iris pallida]|uniref:Uncharacterized protein n=1 Tax=Iris pallida TaxID=29817 RepID=A0AAX6GWZ7_IRIPA|nr:hypothetical protein M6B38_340505 [Iris pallida]
MPLDRFFLGGASSLLSMTTTRLPSPAMKTTTTHHC